MPTVVSSFAGGIVGGQLSLTGACRSEPFEGVFSDASMLARGCISALHQTEAHIGVKLRWRCCGRRRLIDIYPQGLADHAGCEVHGDDDGAALKPV